MSAPKVSIGVPVYNAQRYLREALGGLRAQTLTDFEIVLCDNASTDATADICRQYAARDARVRYHRNATNLGVVANFNRAFELSTGQYFKWAAYDDLHAPTYLERCAAVLDAQPAVAVCHCQTRSIDEHVHDRGEFPATFRLDVPAAPERFRRMIWTDAFPPIWGLFRAAQVRRSARFEPYMGSDRNFLAEMVLMGTVAYVPEPLFMLREHAGSYTTSGTQSSPRQSWYAPGRRVPSWFQVPRTAMGYLGAIRRSNLPLSQKAACTRHVAGWVATCAGQLLRRRLTGRSSNTTAASEIATT
jgi:glycosyltransferase involved in cell wall biosynthesis